MRDDENRVTRAAKDIDQQAAMAAALVNDVYHERYREVVDLQKAALSYASLTMGGALAHLAMDAKAVSSEKRIKGMDGWHGFSIPAPHDNTSTRHRIDLLLVNEQTPGGFLFTMKFSPEMTADAKATYDQLNQEIYAAYESAGVPYRQAIVREMFGKDAIETPARERLARLKNDKNSYVPLTAHHKITEMSCTALDMGTVSWEGVGLGGRHPALASSDAEPLKKKTIPLNLTGGWQRGKCFAVTPPDLNDYLQKDAPHYMGRQCDVGALPEIPMEILSGLIRASELDSAVTAANEIVRQHPWWTSGVAHYPQLEEAGYALMDAAGGMFDARVSASINAFSQAIAASDVGKNVDEWRQTAEAMIAEGVTSAQDTFDCNDLRDIAHAGRTENGIFQVTETQHGTFCVEMQIGTDDQITQVNISTSTTPIARFTSTPDGWVPDYAARDDLPEIPHHIELIRNLNTVVGSLSSVACVWAEEREARNDGGMTP